MPVQGRQPCQQLVEEREAQAEGPRRQVRVREVAARERSDDREPLRSQAARARLVVFAEEMRAGEEAGRLVVGYGLAKYI